MDRRLTLEFVRVTEAAALASSCLVGKGDKIAADDAAVEAMRAVFDSVPVRGTVVIGEGELDEAPMLYIGEKVGNGEGPEVDIAVDPLEGTNLVSKGQNGSIAVMAIAEKGGLLHAPDTYMDKIAVGPAGKGLIDLDAPVAENLSKVAKALGKPLKSMTVVVLDRPRNQKLIDDIRACGARIHLITDGDVAPVLAVATPDSGIDMMMGIGCAPEGVLGAAALKCMGGEMQGRLKPDSEEELVRSREMVGDENKLLTMDELVKGEDVIFTATGITQGTPLQGVIYTATGAKTHTVVLRSKTGTIRYIETEHIYDKKPLLEKIKLD